MALWCGSCSDSSDLSRFITNLNYCRYKCQLVWNNRALNSNLSNTNFKLTNTLQTSISVLERNLCGTLGAWVRLALDRLFFPATSFLNLIWVRFFGREPGNDRFAPTSTWSMHLARYHYGALMTTLRHSTSYRPCSQSGDVGYRLAYLLWIWVSGFLLYRGLCASIRHLVIMLQ